MNIAHFIIFILGILAAWTLVSLINAVMAFRLVGLKDRAVRK